MLWEKFYTKWNAWEKNRKTFSRIFDCKKGQIFTLFIMKKFCKNWFVMEIFFDVLTHSSILLPPKNSGQPHLLCFVLPWPPWSPTSISEPNKVQQVQFQMSGILFFTSVQILYGPKISRFLPCMLQYLDNLRWLFIFSNYIGEIDHFMLDLRKRSDT